MYNHKQYRYVIFYILFDKCKKYIELHTPFYEHTMQKVNIFIVTILVQKIKQINIYKKNVL